MAYVNYPREKLNHTWLTLQSVFNQIILNHGDNNYSIDHLSKAKFEWMGQLLDVLDVMEEVATLYHFNTPTKNPNEEMDEVEMGENATAKEVEENTNTNDMNPSSMMKEYKLKLKINTK